MASSAFLPRLLPARLRAFSATFTFLFVLRWLLLAGLVGALAGTASAGFLISLEWVTHWRETHPWALALLPAGGLLVGLAYHYFGNRVVKGNNLILDEIHAPGELIPLRLVPLVLGGTLVTHLLGGSAGREGTAVQLGGALADQLSRWLPRRERRLLLIAGMSAGFASVFGTPLAGAVFGLEVFVLGSVRYGAILPSFLAAVVADAVTRLWGVGHTHYPALPAVPLTATTLGCTLLAGALFRRHAGGVIYLFAAASAAGREAAAPLLLLDEALGRYAGQPGRVFDFEGGSLPGIGRFFANFGARPVQYAALSLSRRPWYLAWMRP